MERLEWDQLQALLKRLHELYSVQDLAAFATRALAVVRELIPGVSHMYLDVGDQPAVGLPDAALPIGIGVHRERPTVTERDRAVLDLLRPHLAQAYRNAEAMTRLGQVVEAGDQGVIVVDGLGTVQFATVRARRWLDYYGQQAGAAAGTETLPEPVLGWLRRQLASLQGDDAPAPLTLLLLEGAKRRLLVRLPIGRGDSAQHVLLLEEHKALSDAALRPLGLSRREGEVMHLLMCGYTGNEIAEQLVISVRTAEKHLEHIYAKFGVRSAGAARQRIARLLRDTT